MTTLRIYSEEGHCSRLETDQLFESKKNWFIGWKCLAGTRSLTIDQDGNIHSAHCKSIGAFGRQGSYGNLFSEFSLERSPINCARRFCETEFDLSIPKYHRPKFADILTGNSRENPVEKTVAVQGNDSLKMIHWNISAFGLRPLSQWKECVHKLEVFFKGETGHLILQDPPIQSADFFAFLEFITNEKGHEVTVEGHYLSSPGFYQRALSLGNLILRYDGEEKSFFENLRQLGEQFAELQRRKVFRKVTVSLDIKNADYSRLKNSLKDNRWSWINTGYYLGKLILPTTVNTPPEVKEVRKASATGLRILLFIPMRNCGDSIGKVISGLDQKLLQHVSEILILDNDSGDHSMKAATEATRSLQGIKVVIRKNEKNYGFGGSHKLAFQYAHLNKMDYVLIVHGDNSGSPSAFLPVIESGEIRDYDLILSSRFSFSSERVNYPPYRILGNWILNLLASMMTFSRIPDYSGGPVSLYRVQTFINKHENPMKKFSNLISFGQDALLHVNYHRGLIRFVPVKYAEAGGKTLYSAFTQFAHSVKRIMTYRFR